VFLTYCHGKEFDALDDAVVVDCTEAAAFDTLASANGCAVLTERVSKIDFHH
jgi:hypothetical protein